MLGLFAGLPLGQLLGLAFGLFARLALGQLPGLAFRAVPSLAFDPDQEILQVLGLGGQAPGALLRRPLLGGGRGPGLALAPDERGDARALGLQRLRGRRLLPALHGDPPTQLGELVQFSAQDRGAALDGGDRHAQQHGATYGLDHRAGRDDERIGRHQGDALQGGERAGELHAPLLQIGELDRLLPFQLAEPRLDVGEAGLVLLRLTRRGDGIGAQRPDLQLELFGLAAQRLGRAPVLLERALHRLERFGPRRLRHGRPSGEPSGERHGQQRQGRRRGDPGEAPVMLTRARRHG